MEVGLLNSLAAKRPKTHTKKRGKQPSKKGGPKENGKDF
jgi:hypothetical protein